MAKFGRRKELFLLLSDCVFIHFSLTVLAQFDCSFDNGLCSWTQDASDYKDWTIQSGPTTTGGTGPSGDHTSGDGQYLYVESSDPFIKYQSIRLISPQDQVQAGGTTCFEFFYHMYGKDTGELRVYVAKATGELPVGNETWIRSGDQGNQWNLGRSKMHNYTPNTPHRNDATAHATLPQATSTISTSNMVIPCYTSPLIHCQGCNPS
eukprot:XP_011664137.1 PREDICTED: MAM domain-containing glycosylphosphatidylinositol anchor protein 2-like [Strongylocentrotus purpuratus]